MIIDFHARLTPGPGEPSALLAAMDRAGIGTAAVSAGGVVGIDRLSRQLSQGGRSATRPDNEGVRRAAAASGGRLVPFYFADPRRGPDEYRRAAAGFRGLEISPAVHGFTLGEPGVAALARIAADVGHPVYVVCLGRPGARAEDLAALAVTRPATTFVFGHCGGNGLDTDGLHRLAALPNVLAETSGAYTAVARLAVRRLGAHRVLFGTEYPLQDPRVEVTKLGALGLTVADRRAVAVDNATRLLRLEELAHV
ncbi:amidohydrolase family protein [Catenuloplanes indicus]|uniref:TIM-barrel fold metal-dependent hydrolase n=1 Tax=Catenuloplanes indicus TaxID=137267 RepID=A0AAE3W5B2_9ACTN|nr:amidohydrolase family protein [Catenuloplanes indicus]MDQ0369744.1 putative TIM-barrel fold metal-dependent hydrolase [Catenuloplanes indicus]